MIDGIAFQTKFLALNAAVEVARAALVEQSSAAAESLKGQAGRLVEAVGVFKR